MQRYTTHSSITNKTMKRISEYSAIVESAVRAIELPGGKLEGLYGPVKYGMEAGGKRLRPVMVLMGAEAFGGDVQKAVEPAVGVELFHNFTLLHDDVMDNSALRRGRPSVHARWDANTAILSGDTMLTLATEYVTRVDDVLLRRVLGAFDRMALDVYEGQRLDMDFEKAENVTIDEYIEMIKLKTGALLGFAVMLGALIGGASEEDARRMYDFGMMLGVAFQIEDDWLDTFGDSSTFGKPIGNDIRQNKQTYLLVSGLQSGRPDVEALRVAMAMPASDTKVRTVTRIYEKLGLKESVHAAVSDYASRAMSAIKATSLGEEQKDAFRRLVEKLAGRRK